MRQWPDRAASISLSHTFTIDDILTFLSSKEFDMKNLRNVSFRTNVLSLVLVALICSAGSLTSLASAPSLTITVVNNSSREIRHLYLSPANNDNWGSDQLNNSPIGSGGSRQLSVSWEQSTVKLVAEDQDGCFLQTTVEASGTPEWTIDNNTSRNCGN
jgi:hypothetical protein